MNNEILGFTVEDVADATDTSSTQNQTDENTSVTDEHVEENQNNIIKVKYKFDGVENEEEINLSDETKLKELVEKSKYADKAKVQKNELRDSYNKMKSFSKSLGYESIDEMIDSIKDEKISIKAQELINNGTVKDIETAKKLIEADEIKQSNELNKSKEDVLQKRGQELGGLLFEQDGKTIKTGHEFYNLQDKKYWDEAEAQEISDYLIDNPSVDIGLYIKNRYLENKLTGKLSETNIKTQKEINSSKTANIKNSNFKTGTNYDVNTLTYSDFSKLSEDEQVKIVNENPKLYEKILANANQ